MTARNKESRQQAADRLAIAAAMFASGDVRPTAGSYYRSESGESFPFITSGNRHSIVKCCLLGSIHLAAFDTAGAGQEKTGVWMNVAIDALQNTKPRNPAEEGSSYPSMCLPSINDDLVEKHGAAAAAPALAAWLNRAAKLCATKPEAAPAAH